MVFDVDNWCWATGSVQWRMTILQMKESFIRFHRIGLDRFNLSDAASAGEKSEKGVKNLRSQVTGHRCTCYLIFTTIHICVKSKLKSVPVKKFNFKKNSLKTSTYWPKYQGGVIVPNISEGVIWAPKMTPSFY